MIKIDSFCAANIETRAPVRPIVGLLPGMELIGHNLPTNHFTMAMCLIRWNNYIRECILIRVGENYEPLEIPERILCVADFEREVLNLNNPSRPVQKQQS
jgi:hypothetical protein